MDTCGEKCKMFMNICKLYHKLFNLIAKSDLIKMILQKVHKKDKNMMCFILQRRWNDAADLMG